MKYLIPVAAGVLFLGAAAAQDPSGMAAGIVQQTRLAKQAVASREKSAALDHIHQAMVLANSIEQQNPPGAQPLLVPIKTEIETTTTYTPVKKSKSGTMSAKRLKKNTSIREVQGQVTTTRLDVTAASQKLPQAEAALNRDDWMTANTALAEVLQGISQTTGQGDMPLLMARQNLMLARSRVLEDKYKDAAVPLRSAAQALADFEKEWPGPEAEHAGYMRGQIDNYSRVVKDGHPPDAADRIDAWLGDINQWLSKAGAPAPSNSIVPK